MASPKTSPKKASPKTSPKKASPKAAAAKPKKERAAKKEKAPKVKGTTKLNPYMNYSNSRRDALRAANPTLKITEISKLIGDEWKALSAEQKAKFSS